METEVTCSWLNNFVTTGRNWSTLSTVGKFPSFVGSTVSLCFVLGFVSLFSLETASLSMEEVALSLPCVTLSCEICTSLSSLSLLRGSSFPLLLAVPSSSINFLANFNDAVSIEEDIELASNLEEEGLNSSTDGLTMTVLF